MLVAILSRSFCLFASCQKIKNYNMQDIFACETWSLTLREEHRPRVFENRVVRIFGPKRDEVTGGRRTLHKEELRDLHSSTSVIRIMKSRRIRWEGHVARVGKGGRSMCCW
jgi:hypothetical protein